MTEVLRQGRKLNHSISNYVKDLKDVLKTNKRPLDIQLHRFESYCFICSSVFSLANLFLFDSLGLKNLEIRLFFILTHWRTPRKISFFHICPFFKSLFQAFCGDFILLYMLRVIFLCKTYFRLCTILLSARQMDCLTVSFLSIADCRDGK